MLHGGMDALICTLAISLTWLTTKQLVNHRVCWAPGSSCLAANSPKSPISERLSATTPPTLGQSDVALSSTSKLGDRTQSLQCHL